MQRIIGLETEYASGALEWKANPTSRRFADQVLEKIVATVARQSPCAMKAQSDWAGRTGFFLANGSRVYVDGASLEYATAEAASPAQAVAYALAGDRLVLRALQTLQARGTVARDVKFYKLNHTLGTPPTTRGSHENYSIRGRSRRVSQAVVPFLASRVIFTGGGGLDPHVPLRFTMSPRASFLSGVSGWNDRVLLNGRDEPLAGGGVRRFHLVCGESLCGHLGNYLRLGTTALVIRMAEAGIAPAISLSPVDPLEALQAFARDVTCRTRVSIDGSPDGVTAIQIQRAYLDLARKSAGADWMPAWSGDVIERWAEILDLLEEGAPESVSTRLDWAMKWQLLNQHATARLPDGRDLAAWGDDLDRLAAVSGVPAWQMHPDTAGSMLNLPPVREQLLSPAPLFDGPDPRWNHLAEVLRVRQELQEIDLRFNDLDEAGLFNQLDAAGVLEHRVPSVSDELIDRALHEPPQTRAARRVRAMKQLTRRGRVDFVADWHRMVRNDRRVRLEMLDPSKDDGHWTWVATSGRLRGLRADLADGPLLADLQRMYDQGEFHAAYQLAKCLSAARVNTFDEFDNPDANEVQRLLTWSFARLCLGDPTAHLNRLHPTETTAREAISDALFAYRVAGLHPHPKFAFVASLVMNDRFPTPHEAEFAEPVGYWHLCEGRLEQAVELLEPLSNLPTPMRGMRVRAALADAYRRLGRMVAAQEMLLNLQRHGLRCSRAMEAEHILPIRAKLCADRALRRHCLREAMCIHKSLRCDVGEARSLILLAREGANDLAVDDLRAQIQSFAAGLPALRECPTFVSLMNRWERWVSDPDPDETGDYWWAL